MRGLLVKLAVGITTFAVGVTLTALVAPWNQASDLVHTNISQYSSRERNCELKLATNLMSQRNRQFAPSDLSESSSNDFWSWLKEEIAAYQARPGYEQHSLVLPLTGNHRYEVKVHPLTRQEIESYNTYFRRERLPKLEEEKCYVEVGVYLDGFVCPNWGGVIEADNPSLIHFHGSGP